VVFVVAVGGWEERRARLTALYDFQILSMEVSIESRVSSLVVMMMAMMMMMVVVMSHRPGRTKIKDFKISVQFRCIQLGPLGP
jgi:hypothetical protein